MRVVVEGGRAALGKYTLSALEGALDGGLCSTRFASEDDQRLHALPAQYSSSPVSLKALANRLSKTYSPLGRDGRMHQPAALPA